MIQILHHVFRIQFVHVNIENGHVPFGLRLRTGRNHSLPSSFEDHQGDLKLKRVDAYP